YGDSIYFREANTLYVNLFIPSSLNWKEKRATVTQTTRFPEEDRTLLRLTTHRPINLTLKIRHPFWCQTAIVTINGRRWSTSSQPGTYLAINRMWRNGDVVEVHLAMSLRTEPLPGHPDIIAILYGPIVLAGALGRKGVTPGADIIVNERTIGDMLNDEVDLPVLRGDPEETVRQIKPSS